MVITFLGKPGSLQREKYELNVEVISIRPWGALMSSGNHVAICIYIPSNTFIVEA